MRADAAQLSVSVCPISTASTCYLVRLQTVTGETGVSTIGIHEHCRGSHVDGQRRRTENCFGIDVTTDEAHSPMGILA